MGGLTFFRKDGKFFVRLDTSLDKQRIETDPAFQRTRENMSEFGGASLVGKALRDGFGGLSKPFGDTFLTARLTGLFRKMIENGPGERGQRAIEVSNNPLMLTGFEFNQTDTLTSVFLAPYSVSANANRTSATFDIPDFDTNTGIIAPQGATHFQLLGVAAVLSDYSFDVAVGQYQPDNPAVNQINAIDFTDVTPLGGTIGAPIQLVADTEIAGALPATAVLLAGLAISFYQEVNGQYYLLASGNALRLTNLF